MKRTLFSFVMLGLGWPELWIACHGKEKVVAMRKL
jgi:hypothetical protein